MQGWFWNLLKRWWTLVVAAAVVAVVAFGVSRLHGVFGSNIELSRPGTEAMENTNYNPKRVLLEVFGTAGSTATINFLDEMAQPHRVDNAPLPWAHELVTNDPTLFADLRAQGTGDTTSCRITVDGIVKDERTVTIVNGYTTCLDKSA
ncbi:Probable membrane protein, MmpS [Mycobacteroides abscessus subsp. abscessus]|nr:MmpS family transport accessory protein [Mycobacteroides abscessus]ETZ88073.1 conserved membrane family protein [Mycobacteroides abscessus MAB_030201_1075]ETZ94767.1 conserved membrane family protein [Mycobacteroides abscessus MAB_030201_1061]EUA46120.1 conserved membrane family protein [Mycobacteroides abscessus 21]EUA64831.1 conserved membrane family protein [Mycobacteroides abscessus 1948]AKP60788.1 membrane protein [Mycobacteroides abscessus UC22]